MRAPLPACDKLVHAGQSLSYTIRTSRRRRTLTLQVFQDGTLRVSAPAKMPLEEIRAFILERAEWIAQKRVLFAARPQARPRTLVDGTILPYLDEALVLRTEFAPRRRPRVIREEQELLLVGPDAAGARLLLQGWYRGQAGAHVASRLAHFAPLVGRAPAKLCIRDQRTRWGSCSSRSTISINWRLMLAPAVLLDYVVVHELCHLLHPNHGPHFWSEVARVFPSYQQARKQLHYLGQSLTI